MERLTRALTWLLRSTEQLVPASRRQWIEGVRAETEQVPAGRAQARWLAGGLWLVFREAHLARKIAYWLGVGAVTVFAAWTARVSLRAMPASDSEALTDRFRILVGLAALAGLPWLARRQGIFGPVGPSIIARLVRIAGCATFCVESLALLHYDATAGLDTVGTGGFSAAEEFSGLAILAAAFATPFVIRVRWPRADRGKMWASPAVRPCWRWC